MWNWSENQIKLVMIRHGATKANMEHRYLGRTDEPLCEEGRNKLQRLHAGNTYPPVDYLFSSPMLRCRETVQILYPNTQPVVVPKWMEMDFGIFEGKNYQDLQGDKDYQAWIDSNGTLPFPEGESREAFILRCKEGFEEMLDQLFNGGRESSFATVGLVVHGGTIMALLSSYYGGVYFDYQVANGEGYLCTLATSKDSFRIYNVEKIKKVI